MQSLIKFLNKYNIKFLKNVKLKYFTSFHIGGKTKLLIRLKNLDLLPEIVKILKKQNLNWRILGGGTNVLVSDDGFSGVIIKIEDTRHKLIDKNLIAKSGFKIINAYEISTKNNLSGFDLFLGLPGTCGGAVFGNAGCFGRSISQIVKKVKVFDINNLKFFELENKDCKFGYRTSRFRFENNLIITEITFNLKPENPKIIEKNKNICLDYRVNKQPKGYSAGCIFKNILIKKNSSEYKNLKTIFKDEIDKKIKGGKLSAGFLIEKLGLKGFRIGDAIISEDHGNFIINLGNAKAEEVLILISIIKQKVRNKFGIQLQEEIEYLY